MTLLGVNMRQALGLFVAVVMLFGATSVIAAQSAEAAYPGGAEWLVFAAEGDDAPPDTDLYAVRADGTTVTPVNLSETVVENLHIEGNPVFSPDGTKLAYTQFGDFGPEIWVAAFDTSGATPVLGTPARIADDDSREPTWSPDGVNIAYERTILASSGSSGTATADDPAGVTLTDSGGSFIADLVRDGDIVVNGRTGATGTVTNVVSATQLTTSALTGGVPDNGWLATDGYTITFVESRSHHQIYWSPANGGNVNGTRLSPSGSELLYDDAEPAWSPDGSSIAFTSTEDSSNSDILVLAMSGTTPGVRTNLTETPNPFDFDNVASRPSWSPDGTRIAFQIGEAEGSANSPHKNIWTIAIAGGGSLPDQVTGTSNTGTNDELAPAWSPDGTEIAFRQTGTGGDKVWAINADGSGSARRVGNASGAPLVNNEPDWQPVLEAVNDTPPAVDEGGVMAAFNVLDNDLTLAALAGTPSVAVAGPAPANAESFGLSTTGVLSYTHDGSETTSDTFTYTVTQGAFTDTATVTITVNPVDEAPVAAVDEYFVSNGVATNIAAPGVLENDEDPEGGGMTAVKVVDPTHGTLTLNPNGSFTYTHDGTETSFDSFTYKAKDAGGNESAETSVSINVGPIDPDPPTITVSGPSFGAPGLAVSFDSAIVDGSGPRTYTWSVMRSGVEVGSGSSSALDFTPSLDGLHTVTVTVVDDAGSDSEVHSFMVLADIEDSIFASNILWLAEEGITKGCNPAEGNTKFCPDDFVTRGQMAAFLVRFLGLTDSGTGNLFTDDDGSIFETNIDRLATAGITLGCNPAEGNTKFCPDDLVTRGQMAAFLVRALGLTDSGTGNLFTDDDGSIFETNIDRLATAGITLGCNPADGNTKFCPDDFVTRGQMAAFLQRSSNITK